MRSRLATLVLVCCAMAVAASSAFADMPSAGTADGERALRETLARYPYQDAAWTELVEVLLQEGRAEAALATAREGLGMLGDHPALLMLAAWSAFQSQRYLLARSYYQRSINASGANATNLAGVGWSMLKLGSWSAARHSFGEASRLDSTNISVVQGEQALQSPYRTLQVKLGYSVIDATPDVTVPSATVLFGWNSWKAYFYIERFRFLTQRDDIALGVSPTWNDWRFWLECHATSGDNSYFFPQHVYALRILRTEYMESGALDLTLGAAGSDMPYAQAMQGDLFAAWRTDRWRVGAQFAWIDLRYFTYAIEYPGYTYYGRLGKGSEGAFLRVHGEVALWRDYLWLGAAGEWGERSYLVHPEGFLVDNTKTADRVLQAHAEAVYRDWRFKLGVKHDSEEHDLWFAELSKQITL